MLRPPNPSPALGGLLDPLAAATYGRLVTAPLDTDGDGQPARGWVGVDELLAQPSRLDPLLEAASRRFRSDDRTLLSAQVARESVATLATVGVHLWTRERRLPDLTMANVALRAVEPTTQVGLRSLRCLAVLAGDPLAGAPDVEVVDEEDMFERLLHQVFGHAVSSGAVPEGPRHRVAAMAAIVATVRRAVRCGDRHLWGSAALAAGRVLAMASHTGGPRPGRDRQRLFDARPDLARTVEQVSVDDGLGGELTFTLRRTCCLLLKLPDGAQCGTCSLHDHDACVAWTADYHRQERRAQRGITAS